MESESASSPTAQLADLRRAELLTHTRYPTLGPWYPPTFGLAAAIFVSAYALPIWATIPVWVVLLGGGGALARWYLDKRGTIPDWKQAPEPIKREMTLFFVAYTAVIAVIAGTYFTVSWWAAGIVAFITFTALIAVYERRYAAAARTAELDAGIAT